ncbi:MAG TPA: DUF1566 domain-containing protein [Gammaproteobacteria bacterium]
MIRRAWLLCLLVPALAGAQSYCDNDNIPVHTPSEEFEIHVDGTVTHLRTGLMWTRCPVGTQPPTCSFGAPKALSWEMALQEAASSDFAGYGDWRLPNRAELASLVEHCRFGPAVNEDVFPSTLPVPFWTSTPAAPGAAPEAAWVVMFHEGHAVPVKHDSAAAIRLVRTVKRVYKVGDVGPAGGIVFYDKGDDAGGWRYLEAAPKAWSGAHDPWVTWGCAGMVVGTNATAIGAGKASTAALVAAGCSDAARMAAEAVINGHDDWFLPSRDELVAMHTVLAVGTNFLDKHGLQPMSYASASEIDAIGAIAIDFAGGGGEVQVHKSLATVVVRPVRAF